MPTVSVIMPVYNAAEYLSAAVKSILDQSFFDIELIVVDDGSTDGSVQIARSFGDPRVTVLSNGTNLGVAASLNIGIANARGRFIARMDADDISHPQRIIRQLDFLEHNSHVAVCGSWVRCFGESNRAFLQRYPVGPECVRAYLVFANALAHPTVMIDRERLKGVMLQYDTRCAAAQDYELWVRLSQKVRLDNIPAPLVAMRLNEKGVTRAGFRQSNEVSLRIQKALLMELGIEASQVLLRFHRQVGNGSGMRSTAELDAAARWLARIVQASEKHHIVRPEAMRRAAAMVWFRVCLNSAWIGPSIFGQYLRMPFWKAYRPGGGEIVFAVISALTRYCRGPTGRLPECGAGQAGS